MHDTNAQDAKPAIIRRGDMGLTIAGTRVTLYAVLDYLRDQWPPHLIRDWLGLTQGQLSSALDYIAAHRDEVEAEYQQVLREADENRRYWEERNRERFARINATPPSAGQQALRAKLAEHKARLAADEAKLGHG